MTILTEAVLAWHAVMSPVAFFAYAWDKAAARRRGARRVPEMRLHLLALLGGWPGAWLARGWLRHKTEKAGFTALLALATLSHAGACGAVGWYGWGA